MEKLNWQEDKITFTQAYYTAINSCNIELFGLIKENYDALSGVYPMIEYVIERINAVTVLINEEVLWDADIIVRSALETLVKFVFLADASEAERPGLLDEFWNGLSEVYSVKLHEQAKKNLRHTAESEVHRLAYSPLVLSEEEVSRLRTKWPKAERTKLEQKWSFSGIVNFLSQKNKGTPMEVFEFLTHSYRMSSHLAHGDEMGISLIQERRSRTAEEELAVHAAHYVRLLSDCFSYCLLTAIYTTQYLKVSPDYFFELGSSLSELNELMEQYHKVPFDDKMYDKFR